MIALARVAAYEVLRAVDEGRADLPHALARARSGLADERDRALAGEIAAGTLRWQAAFDHVIAQFAGRPLPRLDPEILIILRLTIFQLLHLDRVPASAAVNDAVSLARKVGKRSAAPLVNAVLRRVSRERDRLPLPPRPAQAPSPDGSRDPSRARPATGDAGADRGETIATAATLDREAALDYLSVTLSHPRWLAARWLDRYGFQSAEAWMRFDNGPAALTLRANRLKTTTDALRRALDAAGVQTSPGRFAPDALVVIDGNALATPLASEGLFVVQEEASQLVPLLADVRPGERVLDACASPGGKTTAMAAAMEGRGRIVATDVRGRRIDLLARTVEASGATNVSVVRADVAAPLPFRPLFDCVLLDAPCSGLGTLRRDPDIRWRRDESELPALAATQLRMLIETARVVRPGGRLVYATCSSEPEENEEVVAAFLSSGGFEAVVPDWLPETVRPLVNAAGHLRTFPHRDGLEAFFGAVMRKRG